MPRLLLILWSLLIMAAPANAAPTAATPHLAASLIAETATPRAGDRVTLGIRIAPVPGWHIYWENPGESGLAPTPTWVLPTGATASRLRHPLPSLLVIQGIASNVHAHGVTLLSDISLPAGLAPGTSLPIALSLDLLVCSEGQCVPEKLTLDRQLTIGAGAADPAAAAQFAAARAAIPVSLAEAGRFAVENGQIRLFLPIASPENVTGTHVFLREGGVALVGGLQKVSPVKGGVLISLGAVAGPVRSAISGVVRLDYAHQPSAALDFGAKLGPVPSAGEGAFGALATFLLALGGAILGGLLLNLMPCVFPVLAIKVISFTRHANDRRGHRISGLAYSAGVVISFLALGTLMLGLRSAGEQLGWGFQLQSPAVVAALAVLFTMMGLNLAGLFEFGQFLPSRLSALEAKNPTVNAFLSGVLAVAVASPCTAPFMGASLGLALSLPALQALLVFASIGVGMALPYLAASLIPAVARWLPRPGVWMDTFRRAMAFPMFATVVWLVWVLGQQTGIDGAGALLALLVAMSGVLWSLGLPGRSRWLLTGITLLVLALMLAALGRNVTRPMDVSSAATSSERWQAWAPGRVEQVLATGVPVFVDFTAAWCVTCQYNKKTTLANADVLSDLTAKKVTMLRADWTRRDPAITSALAQLGRNGVPVYVLYQAGKTPVVLSEILTVQELRTALATL